MPQARAPAAFPGRSGWRPWRPLGKERVYVSRSRNGSPARLQVHSEHSQLWCGQGQDSMYRTGVINVRASMPAGSPGRGQWPQSRRLAGCGAASAAGETARHPGPAPVPRLSLAVHDDLRNALDPPSDACTYVGSQHCGAGRMQRVIGLPCMISLAEASRAMLITCTTQYCDIQASVARQACNAQATLLRQ